MATTQTLLSPALVKKCKTIAAANTEYSKRATALLALHAGSSQAEAASQADLTINQVKYWLNKFRQLGIKAFPQTATDTDTANPTEKATIETKKPTKKDKKKSKSDGKKAKKDKKEKKTKKAKKKDKDKKKAKKK